jgi:magnesium transporter
MIHPDTEIQFISEEIGYGVVAKKLIPRGTITWVLDALDRIWTPKEIQAVDSVELYREMLNDLMNLHQSGMNNKQNEILKVLTVFSVVFIPLTFIAGVYGTNFEFLPELHHPYAYYIFWGAEILLGLAMLLYFKSRDWL